MKEIAFEWDATKARLNLAKHGISFEEAATVFRDEIAVQFFDDEHSGWEDRFLLLGRSERSRLLIVCHCERASGSVIRIFSARKATSSERDFYPGV